MDVPPLEALIASYPLATEPAWYAVDVSVWPRCDAETSPERGYYPHPYRHSHGQPIVAGWNYFWLVQVPSRCSSWTAPLRMRRMRPGEHANLVVAEQIRSWLRQAPPAAAEGSPPIFSFDAGYDSVQLSLALADEPACLLVRLRAGHCFYSDPISQAPTGRPRRHGATFVCKDPTTWPEPANLWSAEDAEYGHVQLQAWRGLHPIPQQHAEKGTHAQPHARPLVRGTLIRLEVERLPWPTKTPVPLRPCGSGGGVPPRPTWRRSGTRTSRVSRSSTPTASSSKRSNGRRPSCVRLRRPTAWHDWTWLLLLASVQLRLARDLVADVRLPWQRRGFASLLTMLGSPVNVPKPWGRSPGRPKGKRSQPAQRFPAVKLTP